MRALQVAVVAVAVTTLAACTHGESTRRSTTATRDDGSSQSVTTGGGGPPGNDGSVDNVALGVDEIGSLDEPLALTFQPGSPSLFVAERVGRVRKITVTETIKDNKVTKRAFRVEPTPILDISARVVADGERGLLGITFSPDGRRLYLSYDDKATGDSVVDQYTMTTSRADAVDKSSRQEIIRVKQPDATNHKGGDVHFGPDGYLYWGLGDGGSQGDPSGNGQNTKVPLAKLLRIDPDGADDARSYGIPNDNPFADAKHGLPEVYLYGVRNPWRFTFDAENGDLWIADVGGSQAEEINLLPAETGSGIGANLGWNVMEGTKALAGGTNPAGAVLPVFEYGHGDGECAIAGGYVYRGKAIESLAGVYLFADYCKTGIRGLRVTNGEVVDEHTWPLPITSPVSFGQGPDHELYVLSKAGPIYRLTPAE